MSKHADATLTPWRGNDELYTLKWSDMSTETVVENRCLDNTTTNRMFDNVEPHVEKPTEEMTQEEVPLRTDDPSTIHQNEL